MASTASLQSTHELRTDDSLEQGRVDLAVALRWAVRLGLSEGVDNHFSMAVPDEEGRVPLRLALVGDYRIVTRPCRRRRQRARGRKYGGRHGFFHP